MKKKLIAALLSLLLLAVLLTACGSPRKAKVNESPSETTSAPEDQPSAPETTSAPEDQPSAPEMLIRTLTGGSSQTEAEPIELGTYYTGTYREGNYWLCFTTEAAEDVPYTITMDNFTVDSDWLSASLYDADGTRIQPEESNNRDSDFFCVSGGDGRISFGTISTLQPNTTYFLSIGCANKAAFSLSVSTPSQPLPQVANRPVADAEEPLPFGTNQDGAPLLNTNVLYRGKYPGDSVYTWFAFTTSEEEDVTYTITVENLSVGSEPIWGTLFDSYGRVIGPSSKTDRHVDNNFCCASEDGIVSTGWFKSLSPNTTYFILLNCGSKAEFSLSVSASSQPLPQVANRPVAEAEEPLAFGTNQDEAPLLNTNVLYRGKYTGGINWLAFTTSEEEDVTYTITVENLSVGSEPIWGTLFDSYGRVIGPSSKTDRHVDNNFCCASEDGIVSTGWFKSLSPNTTYFILLNCGSKAEYLLRIEDPSVQAEAVSDSADAEDNLVGSILQDGSIVPGTSQSSAMNIPLETKASGKYAGGYAWLAFTTGDAEDTEYSLTVINCTVGSEPIWGNLYDAFGRVIGPSSKTDRYVGNNFCCAYDDGTASTGWFGRLAPNTTYYVLLTCNSKPEYTFQVRCNPPLTDGAQKTSTSLADAQPPLRADEAFRTGTNQNNATLLQANVQYHGAYNGGNCWLAFTTSDLEDLTYSVSVENLTTGSKPIWGHLYDSYGRVIGPSSKTDRYVDNNFCFASEDGAVSTGWFEALAPNTTYYIRLECESKAEYLLTINAPLPEENPNTITPEEAPVFEVPFELNETQVRFIANEAEFLNPEEAKAALAPVAEVILAHPEHPILLAGTTATFGQQDRCVTLSQRRAEAVKNMLTEEFGVPEEQLLTVGLGYADDPFVRGRDVDANGNFVETEGAKNRRVVVLDADSEIGRQILNGQ